MFPSKPIHSMTTKGAGHYTIKNLPFANMQSGSYHQQIVGESNSDMTIFDGQEFCAHCLVCSSDGCPVLHFCWCSKFLENWTSWGLNQEVSGMGAYYSGNRQEEAVFFWSKFPTPSQEFSWRYHRIYKFWNTGVLWVVSWHSRPIYATMLHDWVYPEHNFPNRTNTIKWKI